MFTTKEEIRNWLKEIKVNYYTIHDDLTVDVQESVILPYTEMEALPVQFGRVEGIFQCSNLLLKTLKGCPKYVEYSFFCEHNKLTSLEGAPLEVGWHFYCHDNFLENLYGVTESKIEGSIIAGNNPINNLEYLPKELLTNIILSHEKIVVEGFEEFYNIDKDTLLNTLSLSLNEIKSIYLEHKLNKTLAINNTNNKKFKV